MLLPTREDGPHYRRTHFTIQLRRSRRWQIQKRLTVLNTSEMHIPPLSKKCK
jgi:hypothetical protein